MLLLDPSGRPVAARFLVAAEWVGISTSIGARDATLRFVSGGIAHAVDPHDRRVLCGAGSEGLETFATDFDDDQWAFRCPECRRQASLAELDQL